LCGGKTRMRLRAPARCHAPLITVIVPRQAVLGAARLCECTAVSIADWHPRAVTQDQMAVCHDCGLDQAMVIGHDVLVVH
jgi:hypothetical protein